MVQIGIYTPFLALIGGGERYILTLANALQEEHKVSLISPFAKQYRDLAKVLAIDLSTTNFVQYSLEKSRFWIETKVTKKTPPYDIFICLSNHIYPSVAGMGKKNILMIQFPYPYSLRELGIGIQERLHHHLYQRAIVYSQFTADYVRKRANYSIEVVYPPVEVEQFKFIPYFHKKNQIISVGRFIGGQDSKRQLEMIRFFKQLYDRNPHLHLEYLCAGSTRPEAVHQAYIEKVKQEVGGYPIHLLLNIDISALVDLYAQSKVFWHAKGYAVSSNRPEFTEHFGISTVEAMASGCVPVVFKAGGQIEVVQESYNGFLWETGDEIIQKTERLLINSSTASMVAYNAFESSKSFSHNSFERQIKALVQEIISSN